jgi:hypothetical protein
LSITDKLLGALFSDISLSLVLPIVFGVLIILFPTIIYDLLVPVNIYFPEFLWGGVKIPLEIILTQGFAQGLLACAIPVFIGLAWNRWAGGAAGFLLSVIWVMASVGQFGEWFFPTADWLGLIVSGMLVGYIAGALMARSRMRGSDSLKSMLIAALVPAIIAVIFTSATYVWYSPMFISSTLPPHGTGTAEYGGLELWDSITYTYFINAAIYGVWAILGAVVAKVSSWFS